MKIFKSIYNLFFIIFFSLFINISLANVNQLQDYYKTIRCLVCDGQSIQESDTEFAINLKEQIQKKYDSGMDLPPAMPRLAKPEGPPLRCPQDRK